MCGRYVNVASTADLRDEYDVEQVLGNDLARSWNIAPTDPVRAVMKRRPHGAAESAPRVRQLRTLRWGLVPSWSRDARGAAKMINARVETVMTKPAFKAAAVRRRCLCPAQGYFEWQKTEDGKVPHFLHDPDGRQLAFAGLYEVWRDPAVAEGEDDTDGWLWTCTIITRPAADLLGHIHDRTPVIVPVDLQESWLDCTGDGATDAQRILNRIPEPHLQADVVSAAVGNVRNNGPDLVRRVDASQLATQERLPLEGVNARGTPPRATPQPGRG